MQNQKCLSFRILEKISFIELQLTRIFLSIKIIVNKIFMRILHSGSALAFQARGAGSIPAIRSLSRRQKSIDLATKMSNIFVEDAKNSYKKMPI